MLWSVLLFNVLLIKYSYPLCFSANDNDMTMDEGMAFTIGELPFELYAVKCQKLTKVLIRSRTVTTSHIMDPV